MARHVAILVILSSWLALAPVPAVAQQAGSALVYRCGAAFENLCRFTVDGSPPAQLTSDGVASGPLYASPSLSADGSKLAFTFGNDVYVGDRNASIRSNRFARRTSLVVMRPDGGQIATVEPVPEITSVHGGVGYYVCGHQLGPCVWNVEVPLPGFVNYLFTYDAGDASGGSKHTVRRQPTAFAWAGSRLLSDSYDAATQKRGVCLLVANDFKCERDVAKDPRRSLSTPAVSPDGAWLAVTACGGTETQETCAIALYSMDGAFIRDLGQGPDDVVPAWSPDSAQVAFNRGKSIWAVDREGGAGTERLLIDQGIQATWASFPDGAGVPVAPAPEPVPPPVAAPGPAPAPAPAGAPANLADELTDWGVRSQDTLQARVGTRTPTTIPGGQVVTTAQVVELCASDAPPLLIDALADAHGATMPGATRLPDAGQPGSFDDDLQAALSAALEEQTGGDTSAPTAFFCQGAQCWESYNAALRAIHLGYTNVSWYRGGLAAWQAANQPLE